MEKYGYIRVSTREQKIDRQVIAMKGEGIYDDNIYVDIVSGKDFERVQYRRMKNRIKPGDLIVIKSIDRLGRNYREILYEWKELTQGKQANIHVIDMPLLNTNVEHESLTGIFVSDIVLQILAYVAETERVFIKQRQAEGIAIAKEKGVHFGREKSKLPDDFEIYSNMWKNGEITVRDAAKKLDMSYSTFYRRCKDAECFK